MAARSIASLSLSFGLVSIPIKLYSATESSSAIQFKLLGAGGSRVRQQYVMDAPGAAQKQPPRDDPDEVGPGRPEEPDEAEPIPPSRRAMSRQVESVVPARASTLPPAPYPAAYPAPYTAPYPAAYPAPYPAPVGAPAVVERSEMVKGYEFEKGKFVVFTADELRALEERSRQTIDIVAFIPAQAVDPIYYHKAYFLVPDKRGAKAYNLLLRAMSDTGRCALAKWAFRSKEYVAQIRPAQGGMVLQQLFYAEEVRSLADLNVERVDVGDAELKLAKQLIEQISVDAYDPAEFVDEEKKRILAAVQEKIAGKQIVAHGHVQNPAGAQVVDLIAALRASLQKKPPLSATIETARSTKQAGGERKPVKRAATKSATEAAPAKGRAGRR